MTIWRKLFIASWLKYGQKSLTYPLGDTLSVVDPTSRFSLGVRSGCH